MVIQEMIANNSAAFSQLSSQITLYNNTVINTLRDISSFTSTILDYSTSSKDAIMICGIIWAFLVALILISLMAHEKNKNRKCKVINYILWVPIFVLTLIGLPASTLLVPFSILFNNMCSELDILYTNNFANFAFSSNADDVISTCFDSSHGDMLSLIHISYDYAKLSTKSLDTMITAMSFLGNSSLQLPVHSSILSQYEAYYSNTNYLEIIYGSSLSVLLTNAGAELSLNPLNNPTYVAFASSQCPASSTLIYSNTSLSGKNKCIIVKESEILAASYSGLKIESLYNFRKDIYNIITALPNSIKNGIIATDQTYLNAISADYNPLISNLVSMNNSLTSFINITKEAYKSLNCSLIGENARRIIIGFCGHSRSVICGVVVALAILSVSSFFVVVLVAVYNKSYSHNPTEIVVRRIGSPPSEILTLKNHES